MRLEQNDELAARVAGRVLGVKFSHPMVGMVVRDDAGKGRGVVIFNNYNARNIDMTGVGVGCWTVPVIRDLARYVFQRLGVKRVTAQTRHDNIKARMALRRMGFREEGTLQDWFDDGEKAIIYGLTAREQRLIR